MSHTIHIKPCKIKLCIESHSTGLSDRVRNTRRYAHGGPTFSEITDHVWTPITANSPIWTISSIIVNPIRIYISLLTPMADDRPVGVGRVTTSSIPIDRKHSHNDPHLQFYHINSAHSPSYQRQQISSAASTYLICIRSESKSYSRGSDTTIGIYGRVRQLLIKNSYA